MIFLVSARASLPGIQARDSLANCRLEQYSARMEPSKSRRAAWMCSISNPHGPVLRLPMSSPPSLISRSSRLRRSVCRGKLYYFATLFNCHCHGLGALHRFLQSQLGSFVGFGGMAARVPGVLNASVMGAFVALLRGGA